jgi:acyl carrier protein
MANIKDQVRSFIADNFLLGDKASKLADNDSFLDHHILDSTGFLELISFVEESFHIKVHDDEMIPENLDSLANIETFVTAKRGVVA